MIKFDYLFWTISGAVLAYMLIAVYNHNKLSTTYAVKPAIIQQKKDEVIQARKDLTEARLRFKKAMVEYEKARKELLEVL